VAYETIEIERAVKAMGETLAPTFAGTQTGITEENLQSRLRGVILMAISNKFGPMELTTGNKSEMSVGYATLYGDMCGGYNVLKDVYKTEVFALSRWRNAHVPADGLGPGGAVIPDRIIEKPPTAELRANQTDQDSLPPYDILDGILECLVEREMGFEETVARGFDPATVKRVEQLLYVSEYKRRQAPPGVKISSRNFGRDRRYPITNAYRGAR
jgi:NAD+ synthase